MHIGGSAPTQEELDAMPHYFIDRDTRLTGPAVILGVAAGVRVVSSYPLYFKGAAHIGSGGSVRSDAGALVYIVGPILVTKEP